MTSSDSTHRPLKLLFVGAIIFLLCWVLTFPFFSAWRDSVSYFQPRPTVFSKGVSGYETLAVIWLDDTSSPAPILDGLWLAYMPADSDEIELFGLRPAAYQDRLAIILGSEAQPALHPYVRGPLVGQVVFDRDDLRELTDAIGGVRFRGQPASGNDLLNYLAAADITQPDDILFRQAAVIQNLLAEIAVQGKHIDLARLLDVPSLCSLEETKLRELVNRFYPLHLESVRIHTLADSAAPAP